MQVADALGDQGDKAWVDSLAAIVAATDWSDSDATDAMLCTFLRLPEHLLHRIMSACLRDTDLIRLLYQLPAHLHVAAVPGALKDGGVLRFPFEADSHTLAALPWASFPAPGLQAVRMYVCDFAGTPAAAGGLLARALAAHPSLTSIECDDIEAVISPQWLHSFASCLRPGALPHLVDLNLRVDAHPGGYVALASCLRLLPALTSLQATFDHLEPPDSAVVPRSAYARLAGAPASLPELRQLKVYEDSSVSDDDFAKQSSNCLHSFLSLLSAPKLHAMRLEFSPSRVSAAAVLNAVTWSRFPGLKTLHIEAAVDVPDVDGLVPGGCAAPPDLPPLTELSMTGPCSASMLACAAAVCSATAASLTSLHLDAPRPASGRCTFAGRCGTAEVRQVWEPFWHQIGRCSQLAVLHVYGLFGMAAGPRVSVSGVLAAALRQRPQQHRLSMFAVCPPDSYSQIRLSGSILGGALATLTRLTALTISECGCGIEFDEVQPLLDACTQLRSVEQLDLCCPGVTVSSLAAAVPKMPALKSVSLVKVIAFAGGMRDDLDALRVEFPGITFRRGLGDNV